MSPKLETSHPSVPECTAPALRQIASALGLRAKAIKYQSSQFGCTRKIDDGDERLNIDSRRYDSTQIRLSVWSSGEAWVSVHRRAAGAGAGWAVSFSGRGNLMEATPTQVVDLYEQTMEVSGQPERLRVIWSPFGLSQHD